MPKMHIPLTERLKLAEGEISQLRATIRSAQERHQLQVNELRARLETATRILEAVNSLSRPTHNSVGAPLIYATSGDKGYG